MSDQCENRFIAAAMYCLGKLKGKAEDKFLEEVLHTLIEENKQDQLDQIERKIDMGLTAYRRDAAVHLNDALKQHRTLEERDKHLELARLSLVKARSRCTDVYDLPFLSAAIGDCWLLLGSVSDAQGYYSQARHGARRLANDAEKEWRRLRGMSPAAYMFYSYPKPLVESIWFKMTEHVEPGKTGTIQMFQRIMHIYSALCEQIESIEEEVPQLGVRFS